MSRSPRLARLSLPAVALVALGLVPTPRIARAEDAPSPPVLVRKVDHPFLTGLVGSWDFHWKGMGMEARGTTRARLAVGDTVLLQESQVNVPGRTVHVLNVFRMEDAEHLKAWRFDTLTPGETAVIRGTLRADGYDATADGGKAVTSRRTAAGVESVFSQGGQPVYTIAYTKTEKPVTFEAPDAPKDGLRPAMVGTWKVTGEWKVPPVPVSGTSAYAWALGGSAIVHDYERATPRGPSRSLGVIRWPADLSSMRTSWFVEEQIDPMPAEGPTTDDAWHGKGTMPDGSVIGLDWSKQGADFEMRYERAGQPLGSERYVRAK